MTLSVTDTDFLSQTKSVYNRNRLGVTETNLRIFKDIIKVRITVQDNNNKFHHRICFGTLFVVICVMYSLFWVKEPQIKGIGFKLDGVGPVDNIPSPPSTFTTLAKKK